MLERLAQRNVYAITSFIFGMDNDTTGVAERTLEQVRTWPPGLPDFRLAHAVAGNAAVQAAGSRWPAHAAQALAGIHPVCDGSHAAEDDDRGSSRRGEVRLGQSYSPEAIAHAVDSLSHKPLGYRINILIARLCFRGIYFPQMGKLAWVKTILQSRNIIWKLVKEGFGNRPDAIPATAAAVSSSPSASDLIP